ncbi:Protein CHHY-1 [Aphelenchoides avenae]|nr:Protein CHHY-1 [Aphelenchus avenae]
MFVCVCAAGNRFEIFWNIPSHHCHRRGYGLDPQRFGIRTNLNQTYYGGHVVTFYEDRLGLYPKTLRVRNSTTGKWQNQRVNGGVPQCVDLNAHLEKVEHDIVRAIPDPEFDGLAVIDYEAWRPLYRLNWFTRRSYQEVSIEDARQRYPSMSEKSVRAIAEILFDQSAKEFFVKTIQLGRKLRPKARWGFFDYPLCNYDAGETGEPECKAKYDTYNEDMLYMYEESDALFPPIYLYHWDEDSAKRQRYVHARILCSQRVLLKVGLDRPIYIFTKFEYQPYPDQKTGEREFYTEADLCNTLSYAAELGVRGSVLWSTSEDMRARCDTITNYTNDVLGPFLTENVLKWDRCSEELCNGNGRCVLDDRTETLICPSGSSVASGSRSEAAMFNQFHAHYVCDCDDAHIGYHCEFERHAMLMQRPVLLPTTF